MTECNIDQVLAKVLPVYRAAVDFFLEYYSNHSIRLIQDKQTNVQRKLNTLKTIVLEKIFNLTFLNGQFIRFENDSKDILLWLDEKESLLMERKLLQSEDESLSVSEIEQVLLIF